MFNSNFSIISYHMLRNLRKIICGGVWNWTDSSFWMLRNGFQETETNGLLSSDCNTPRFSNNITLSSAVPCADQEIGGRYIASPTPYLPPAIIFRGAFLLQKENEFVIHALFLSIGSTFLASRIFYPKNVSRETYYDIFTLWCRFIAHLGRFHLKNALTTRINYSMK